MESFECLVKDGSVYIQCTKDENAMLSIADYFTLSHHRDELYEVVDDSGIREFLEDNSYPYVVFIDDMSNPASRVWKPSSEKPLQSISGVGDRKAAFLENQGLVTVDDVKSVSQNELTEMEGIGNALAARIKADVGGLFET